jgi:ABC-type multidrug transport system fused ATPase/permease subunit
MFHKNIPLEKYSALRLISRMFTYVKKYRWFALAYLLVSALNTMVSIAFGYIINESVGSAIDHKSSVLSALILQALVIVMAGVFLKYFAANISGIFRSRVMKEVREHAAGHMTKLPLTFIEHNHSGDLISRFTNDLATVQQFIGDRLFQLIIDLLSVVLTSCYLASINLKLFAGSLLIMPPMLLISTFVSRPMGRFYKEASALIGKANALAADSYGGLPIIKAYGLERHFSARFESLIHSSIKANSKGLHRMKFMPIFNILLWSFPFTICLIYGAYLSLQGEISPGHLPAFVYLLNNIVWPVAAIPRIVAEFQQSMGTAQRFFKIMDIAPEREDGSDFDMAAEEECIRFRNVVFSYEKASPILNGMSFSVVKGSRTALVGASGCGKSTVLKLIAGFYENQSGEIEIGDHKQSEWNLKSLRSKILYVSQETYLYPASVRDNITMGRSGVTEEELQEAARAADALDFILELPDGFDTQIGERGVRLSGGQRQRLALARAFLRKAPVVLLDEPTSALDTLSEAQIQEAMKRILDNRTAIIVTHRLSTIKEVDEILVMDQGRIAERGNHQQLLKSNGLYAQLYNRQLESQEAV